MLETNSINLQNGNSMLNELIQKQKTAAPTVQNQINNALEKQPDADKLDLSTKTHTKEKILAGAIAASLVAAAVEGFVFKGRHLSGIWSKLHGKQKNFHENPSQKANPVANPAPAPTTEAPKLNETIPEAKNPLKNKENPIPEENIEKEAADYFETQQKAIEQSNKRNDEWLKNRRSVEEADYSNWWNNEIAQKEAAQITVKKTPNGTENWQYGRKISETTQEKYETITKYFDEAGKITKVESTGSMHRQLETYDPKTGVQKEKFYGWFGKLNVSRNNEEIYLQIPRVKLENFDKAVELARKYENVPKNELESIYKEILNGNPKKISELEFNVIEAHLDLHTKTVPKTSEATQIKEHHYLNGQNHRYRAVADGDFEYKAESQKILAEMKNIDRKISELPPLEKDCIFYRGINSKFIPQITGGKVGDIVIPDKAYAYTGFERNLAQAYGDGTILTIKTPKGARVSRNMEHNGEAVFPRNAEYRILSKGKTPDGNWRIELEYILPESK